MEGIKISLDTTGPSSEITVVRVDGVIDTVTASELEKIMDSLLEKSRYLIIIDLAGVDYISSAGWGIFISNIREIRAHEGDIKLARMIAGVYEIFELLEFDSILQAFDSIEKARNDFNVHADNQEESISTIENTTEFGNATNATVGQSEIVTEEYQPENGAAVATMEKPVSKNVRKKGIENEVLGLIKADPFYTISELKSIVNNSHNGSAKRIGWWKVWNILRRKSLLSKKKRFRFSRK